MIKLPTTVKFTTAIGYADKISAGCLPGRQGTIENRGYGFHQSDSCYRDRCTRRERKSINKGASPGAFGRAAASQQQIAIRS